MIVRRILRRVPATLLACALAGAAVAQAPPQQPPADAPEGRAAADAPEAAASEDEFDEASAVARLEEAIRGKEDRPAKEVFMWLETPLKEVPAGRFLRIMRFGFSRSLGVTCTHCHDPKSWESDTKPQKDVARRMLGLVDSINDQLDGIPGIENPSPIVNCTTCHRGRVKPALRLDEQEPAAGGGG